MTKTNVRLVVYWTLSLILHSTRIVGTNQLIHIRNPMQLTAGECILFKAEPTYRTVGIWTWRKDTIDLRTGGLTSSRITINSNVLRISAVEVTDSAYYSAEVQTTEKRELFKFWLNVKGCNTNEKKNFNFQGECRSWCEKKCDQGWKYFKGGCYKYFGDIKSWENALDSCQSQDAQLAVVDNKEKNEFVGSLLGSGEGAWVGLNDRQTESAYLWNNDKNAKASYFHWAKNEPSNTNKRCNIENCVEMKYPNLKWNDMVCNGYNSYVCQVTKDNVNASSSWSCYGSNCYKYFSTQLIWKDSKMKCEELGAELARVTSFSVNAFIGRIIHSNIWIGLNDIAEPATYVWQDFEVGKLSNKASYFNWGSGEPNDKLYDKLLTEKCSGEDCVQINNRDNVVSWYDMECSKKLPFVCEKIRDSLLTIGALLGISIGCTAVAIIFAALIQFRLKNRKQDVQRLAFNIRYK